MTAHRSTIGCFGVVAAGFFGGLLPNTTLAQSAGPLLEEIVVTARKREEALEDVPTTIQVFSGEELARSGVRDFGHVQQSVPNFNFYSDRAARSVFTLRGFGATTTTNLAPGIGLYVDGVYQPSTAFFNAPLVDLDRVEFLKGPQGTLFGRNAYAGAINLVTRPPGDELDLRVQAELANAETRRVFGSASGPLGKRLRGLLSAGIQEHDGFFTYAASGNSADPNDYSIARSRLVLDATDDFSVDVTGQYFDLDTGGFKTHAVSGIDATNENIRLNEPQYEKARFGDAWLNATWSLGPARLIGITSYSDQRNDSLLDGDFTSAVLINSRRVQDRSLWGQELRVQSTADEGFKWLAGLYYGEGTVRSEQVNTGGFFPMGPVQTAGTEDATYSAAFADVAFDLAERLELGLGLRYDAIKKEGQSANTLLAASGPIRLSAVALDATYDALQPKATLRYAVAESTSVYASYAKGFREGGLNLNAPGTPVQSFDGDEIRSYELGLKSVFGHGRVRLNLAGFRMNAPSYNSSGIFVNPLSGATLVTINVGAAESSGFEADMTARLSDTITLTASGGLTRAEWESVTNAALGTRPGDKLLVTPEWSLNLGLRGEFPVARGRMLEVIGGVAAKGDTILSRDAVAGPYTRDPYALLDLSIGLAGERWRTMAFGRNLTDERFGEAFNQASLLAAFSATNDMLQYNQPRSYCDTRA